MELVLWWLLCVAVWVASLTTVGLAEVLVATVVAVPCALMARHARRLLLAGDWRLRKRWFAGLGSLPGSVIRETCAVLRTAARARRASGYLRTVRIRDDAGAAGRHAVAVLLLSSSPNTVVVDDSADGIIVHSFASKPSRLKRTTGS